MFPKKKFITVYKHTYGHCSEKTSRSVLAVATKNYILEVKEKNTYTISSIPASNSEVLRRCQM